MSLVERRSYGVLRTLSMRASAQSVDLFVSLGDVRGHDLHQGCLPSSGTSDGIDEEEHQQGNDDGGEERFHRIDFVGGLSVGSALHDPRWLQDVEDEPDDQGDDDEPEEPHGPSAHVLTTVNESATGIDWSTTSIDTTGNACSASDGGDGRSSHWADDGCGSKR